MSPLGRLLRRALTRLRSAGRRAPFPDGMDADLVALAGEYMADDHVLRALLEGDGRDTDEIPAFAHLADRQAELVEQIAGTPAQGLVGLVVKARAVRLHPFQVGYDGVATLGWSLAGDVIRLLPTTMVAEIDRPIHRSEMSVAMTALVSRLKKVLRAAGRRYGTNSSREKAADSLGKVGSLILGLGLAAPMTGMDRVTWLSVCPAIAVGGGAVVLSFCLILSIKPPL